MIALLYSKYNSRFVSFTVYNLICSVKTLIDRIPAIIIKETAKMNISEHKFLILSSSILLTTLIPLIENGTAIVTDTTKVLALSSNLPFPSIVNLYNSFIVLKLY